MSKIKEEIEKYRGLYPNMPIDDVTYWCGKPTPLGVGWIAI